ncbi:fructose-1,6-bisphosphatase [Ruminococcus sp.]|uniref:fructose-1,6-bisphosphatase n=1 Tax=Ruminococcus sp. TaxID=41978 RepID=UPI0025E6D515|nr:fructose-1,6-bisphosphatase [Ruminococcus sp.]MBQ6252497.1 fructose-1,6-bisphosphatase [Ruminococcus sp.]MBR3667753.1 fructose-1,6-bisphosphatase [Ruminococcus sp.]
MDMKYLRLLAKEYPTIESAASEIINLSAIRSLPKGTEYFFSDMHGEYEAFLHMLRSASGMIKIKIDLVLGKTVSAADREKLAELIYYPEKEISRLTVSGELSDEWKRLSIYRLILVCETVSAKYTRSRIRKRIPEDMVYILDELLNVTDDVNKDYYYDEIISAIIDTGIAETFIISLCKLIQSVCIDRLHIIGDIFDRGPRADIILDELMKMHDVDIQWGNHDISWMGAAAGNPVLIANVIRIAMRYNNFDVLEDGYGLNLRALAVFAAETYENDDCALYMPNALDDNIYDPVDLKLAAKMHKAITVIQMKLEGQLIAKHPEWEMSDRDLFGRTDFINGTVMVNGKEHSLLDRSFPTVAPESPLSLTEGEAELMKVLKASFRHSEKLQRHIRFIYAKGAMYKTCNNNLLFHGCIPMDENGGLQSVRIKGERYSGKALLDKLGELVNQAYFSSGEDKEYAGDFMWYLWCGARSPLYGKDKMAFFERALLEDKSLHTENYNAYYTFSEKAEVCMSLLEHFGLDPEKGHIINGHVPVKIKNGESPIKADGKLFVIDGGISKAYQSTTGIAGYTLIYDSHSLNLAEHKPFVAGESGNTPTIRLVEKLDRRANISDTDKGEEILDKINDLRMLLEAYKAGTIK